MIKFIPLTSPVISSQLQSTKALQEKTNMFLQQCLQVNPDDVYMLSKCGNDLEAMKHDAVVHFWFSEVGLDEF